MGVTSRHARRILGSYREWGAEALAHGHRGRRPSNATPETVVANVVHLVRTRYPGVNHTHLAELLAEREGIHMGRTTLQRILLDAGLSSPRRRRPPKHRVRRQRMPREGMLIQMDGSYHPWLGDLAPPFTLLIAVDDATGTVVDARFCERERIASIKTLPTLSGCLNYNVTETTWMARSIAPSPISRAFRPELQPRYGRWVSKERRRCSRSGEPRS